MSYDVPFVSAHYRWEAQDMGAGSDLDLDRIVGPAGMKGKIKSVVLVCTETFAGATNSNITVGTAAGGGQFFTLTVDAAGGDAFTANDLYAYNFETATAASTGAPGNSIAVTDYVLDADTGFFVSLNGGTGTLTAGIVDMDLYVDWGNW